MNGKNLSLAVTLTLLCSPLIAQNSSSATSVPQKSSADHKYVARPVSVRGSAPVNKTPPPRSHPPQPSFCDPNCLYYSGDFDPNGPNPQGLWNGSNGTDVGDVWHAFVPAGTGTYIITGASVNIATNETSGGVPSIPYSINTGLGSGYGGTVVCSGTASVTMTPYGTGYLGLNQYNYAIAIGNSACQVNAGTTYWLDIQVQYNDSNGLLYELDVEDANPPNAYGWPSVLDQSFSNSTFFGDDSFVNTSSADGPCDGFGCDLFSFSVSGTPVCGSGKVQIYSNLGSSTDAFDWTDGWLIEGASSGLGHLQWIGYPFTPAGNHTANEIDAAMFNYPSYGSSNDFNFGIWSDSGGLPGTELNGVDMTNLPNWTGQQSDCCNTQNAIIPNTSLISGTQYWVVMSTDSNGLDSSGAWDFVYNDAAGNQAYNLGSGWLTEQVQASAFAVCGPN